MTSRKLIGKPAVQRDFILAYELADLTHIGLRSIYNQHSAGQGPLLPILSKLGGRLGAWREDYEEWKTSQRRLKPAQPAA